MHRILLAAALWCLTASAQAASTIIPGLLPIGVPPNSGLINQNFQNAINDINALQTQNAGVTAPSNPSLGYLWLSTPQNSTTFTDSTWDGHTWAPTGAFDSVNHIWMPPIGGGVPPTLLSGTTTDLGSVPQAVVYVSGGNPIQSFGSSAPIGTTKIVDFLAVTTLTNNSSVLLLPGAANITTAPGDTLFATQVAPGKWLVTAYTRAAGGSGTPVLGPLSSTVGDCAAWNNTSGTLLSDTGHPCALGTVIGPSTTVVGDCAVWSNTLGSLLGDSQCTYGRSVTTFGVVADNTTDNSAALQSAFTWMGTNCGALTLPAGTIYSSTAITWSIPPGCSGTVIGQGQEVSRLRFASGVDGIDVTLNNARTSTLHVRDVSFLAGAPPQTVSHGLAISQLTAGTGSIAEQSDVTNVSFRGSDGYLQTNGWQTGVGIENVVNVNFINDAFFGTLAGYNGTETAGVGLYVVGLTGVPTEVSAQFNVIGGTYEGLNLGIGYDYNTQGIAVSNSTFVLNNIGVFSSATPTQKAGLQFIGNNCNNYVACVQDNTIGGIPFATYQGNIVFLQTNSDGFEFVGNNTVVSGNTIWGAAGSNPSSIGISVTGGSVNSAIISNNTIGGTSGSTMGTGIEMAMFSENVHVSGNAIDSATVTAPIVNNSMFGNRNFITGQPVSGAAQVITGAVSNVQTGSESVSAASPSIVSWTAHGLQPGQGFTFASVGSLTGITAGPTYYVSASPFTANSFAYSATFGGPNVNTGGTTSTLSISTTPALTRITVGTTAGFTTGAWSTVSGMGGVTCNINTPVWVIDATHLDLSTCLFSGFYTGGGQVSTLP